LYYQGIYALVEALFFSDVKGDVTHVLVNTVNKSFIKCTVKQYSDACKARSILDIIGRPITKDYIDYVERDLLPQCYINREDNMHAEDILGPNLGLLKGKTKHKTLSKVIDNIAVDLPQEILEKLSNKTLPLDIMYINNTLMVTTSRAIHFGTAKMIKNENRPELSINTTNH